jgi:anti-sigma factor RsiW
MNQKCEWVRAQLALLLYGELPFDEEEAVESHLETCGECCAALNRQREVHTALDGLAVEPPASLLRECRSGLMSQIRAEARNAAQGPAPEPGRMGWWDRVTGAFRFHAGWTWLKPVGAVALVALGYFSARTIPAGDGPFGVAAVANPANARVRYVQAAPGGQVQLVLDETRQRTVTGALDDDNIRALLMSAAKDPSDPGLRAESVDILNRRAQASDVRDVLLSAMRHDQNAGVRLKAMEGLKAFARDPEVRSALADVLLQDENPGLRTQAIDLLTADDVQGLDSHIVGTLQELMRRESNAYVRQRSQHILQTINASSEIY